MTERKTKRDAEFGHRARRGLSCVRLKWRDSGGGRKTCARESPGGETARKERNSFQQEEAGKFALAAEKESLALPGKKKKNELPCLSSPGQEKERCDYNKWGLEKKITPPQKKKTPRG